MRADLRPKDMPQLFQSFNELDGCAVMLNALRYVHDAHRLILERRNTSKAR